jgi:serine protease
MKKSKLVPRSSTKPKQTKGRKSTAASKPLKHTAKTTKVTKPSNVLKRRVSHARTQKTGRSLGFKLYFALLTLLVLVTVGSICANQYAKNQPTDVLGDTSKADKVIVELKFRDESGIDLINGQFGIGDLSSVTRVLGVDLGGVNAKLGNLNNILKSKPGLQLKPLFAKSPQDLRKEYKELKSQGKSVADLSQYAELKLPKGSNTEELIRQLKTLSFVEDAYVRPPLVLTQTTTPSFVSNQRYRHAAPTGVGMTGLLKWPGSRGEMVRVAFIESGWDKDHEDVTQMKNTSRWLSSPAGASGRQNEHGTAVASIIAGDENYFGVTGLVPRAQLYGASTQSISTAEAIRRATSIMSAGDVITASMAYRINGHHLPLEWNRSDYDAIRNAIAKGIMVFLAAGNSGSNLSDPSQFVQPFPQGRADSGAVVVGAGAGCGQQTPPQRSRLNFSNYGARVNLQGWGNCVTAAGYGVSYSRGTNVNTYYTHYFSGTSSATPIVAASAAAFSSAFEKLNGSSPSPAYVKNHFRATGTPQSYLSGSLGGNIGPQPNLAKAFLATDRTPPATPTNFKVTLNSSGKPYLTWTPATDNVSIAGYNIYRNGVYLNRAEATFTNTTAVAGTTYRYQVAAVDQSSNVSALTPNVYITSR